MNLADNNYFANDNISMNNINGKLDYNSAKLAALSSKYEMSNYLLHRQANSNDYNMKPAQNQLNYEEEQAMLNSGLKNLALRQQERIYSAGNFFLLLVILI